MVFRTNAVVKLKKIILMSQNIEKFIVAERKSFHCIFSIFVNFRSNSINLNSFSMNLLNFTQFLGKFNLHHLFDDLFILQFSLALRTTKCGLIL